MKHWHWALVTCALAWAGYVCLARYLAARDVIGALLMHREPASGVLMAVLLALRLFLILLAPGWLLWLVVRALERHFRP